MEGAAESCDLSKTLPLENQALKDQLIPRGIESLAAWVIRGQGKLCLCLEAPSSRSCSFPSPACLQQFLSSSSSS